MGDALHSLQELDNIKIAEAFECDGTDLDRRMQIGPKDFTLISQNIVSIYKNFDDFTLTLLRLPFETDVIVLTECRLDHSKPLPQLTNYDLYFTTNQLNQNDGVVAYVKKTLKHKVTEIKLHQASCLQINVLNSVVLCIYRSPSNPNTDQFIESLSSHLESIPTHNSIIVTGDININIRPKPQESPQQYRSRMNYLDMLASYGILAGHALPTRIHSCLDHFMLKINKIKYKAMIAVMHTSTTDHFTTLLSISKLKNLPNHNKNKQTINFEAVMPL